MWVELARVRVWGSIQKAEKWWANCSLSSGQGRRSPIGISRWFLRRQAWWPRLREPGPSPKIADSPRARMNRAKIVSTLVRPSPTLFTSLGMLFKSCSFESFVSLKGCLNCGSSVFLESIIVVDCERFELSWSTKIILKRMLLEVLNTMTNARYYLEIKILICYVFELAFL